MQHWLAIVGSGLGIVGTAALSYDLLKSKVSEKSISEFKHLQDQIENKSMELTVRMNSGLSTLANFISGFLSLDQLQEQVASGQNPEVQGELKEIVASKEKVQIYLLTRFNEARKELVGPDEVKETLKTIAMVRKTIEDQFMGAVALSRRLRRIAIVGVYWSGSVLLAQFLDILFP